MNVIMTTEAGLVSNFSVTMVQMHMLYQKPQLINITTTMFNLSSMCRQDEICAHMGPQYASINKTSSCC